VASGELVASPTEGLDSIARANRKRLALEEGAPAMADRDRQSIDVRKNMATSPADGARPACGTGLNFRLMDFEATFGTGNISTNPAGLPSTLANGIIGAPAERRCGAHVALSETESSRGAGQSPSRPRRCNARLVAIKRILPS
jgi:hypothetical protein